MFERVEDRAERIHVRLDAGVFVCDVRPIRRRDRDDTPFFERDWPDFLTDAFHDPSRLKTPPFTPACSPGCSPESTLYSSRDVRKRNRTHDGAHRDQLLQSLDAWLRLGPHEVLRLETEEGFSIESASGSVDPQGGGAGPEAA